jgi:hypothetical protein
MTPVACPFRHCPPKKEQLPGRARTGEDADTFGDPGARHVRKKRAQDQGHKIQWHKIQWHKIMLRHPCFVS